MRFFNLPIPVIVLVAGLLIHADAGRAAGGTHSVGYLSLTPSLTGEDSAAIRWLSSIPEIDVRALNLETVNPGTDFPGLAGVDVLWIHIPDSASYVPWQARFAELRGLRTWYSRGGRFLFTGLAAMIPAAVGIETASPSIEAVDIENDWLFDQRGFQSFRGHPIFDGLFGGTFTWDADSNQRLWSAGFSGSNQPFVGKVVAVDKSYITINAERKLVIGYDNRRGRGIAAGGYLQFGRPNNRRANMEKFLLNAIRYLAGESFPDRATYWVPTELKPVQLDVPPSVPAILDSAGARRGMGAAGEWPGESSGPVIARDSATTNFFDVAGPRVLAMGNEKGGIDELWVHPFRLLREYRAGVVTGDSILWLNGLSPRIEVRPESFTRTYETPFGTVKEEVFAARSEPVAVVRYGYEGRGPLKLAVKFRTDLRLMWPYDSPATGGLVYSFDPASGVFLVSDETEELCGAIGANAVPTASLSGQYDSIGWGPAGFSGRPTGVNQACHAAIYDLDPSPRPSLVVAMAGAYEASIPGTSTTLDIAAKSLMKALVDPAAVRLEAVRHYKRLLDSMVTVESPDREFNDLMRWALVGTDRFLVRTPGVGEGLLAGYSTTARGWDGAQKVSGRPGYAWYFGRDAAWSGFAIDDYGDFATVRAELELMQRYQDLSGKIFHEISTSGSVHYDASDATPLYVLLAAHYLRASGDTAFIRASWPRIRKAMDYLYSTDTDGDGLIENTNQGHGWVEGGALYPVHTEFYLAGAWGKALLGRVIPRDPPRNDRSRRKIPGGRGGREGDTEP